jgi:hypothetical protein
MLDGVVGLLHAVHVGIEFDLEAAVRRTDRQGVGRARHLVRFEAGEHVVELSSVVLAPDDIILHLFSFLWRREAE